MITRIEFIVFIKVSGGATPRVAILGEKVPVGLLSTAVGALQFSFGALLLFELFYQMLATTLFDLRWLFAGNIFRPNVAKSQSIQINYYA